MGVRCAVYLLDERHIITCSSDGSLRLWNLESGVQIGNDWRDDDDDDDDGDGGGGDRRDAVVWTIALSPNGKTVASGNAHDSVISSRRTVAPDVQKCRRIMAIRRPAGGCTIMPANVLKY